MTMTTQEIINLIKTETRPGVDKGKLFEVTFTKKDGTIRKMRCRLGVQRNLTGKGMSWNPEDRGMLTVWSADSQGYRNVNLATVTSLRLPDGHKHLIQAL